MSPPGNQPDGKSLEEKLADVLTKCLVLGGGGYGLYNLLYLEDIPRAAISFGISLTTSLVTSFGQPIIDKWKFGLKSSGEKTADAINEEFGKAASRVLNRGFDKQYFEALKVQCDRIELEGFQNLQPLALDKVYVPLQIQTRDQLDLSGQKTIWDFLPKRYQSPSQSPHRRIAILAAPGYGKTTLMRHLTRTYAIDPPEDTPQFIPVLLRLREIYGLLRWIDEDEQRTCSLSELIVEHIPKQRGCKNLKPSKHWFDQVLKDGKCLVLFDGLDEVPKAQRQIVRQWVDTQMQDYGNVQFILTSRPHGFDLRPDEPSHPIEIDTRLEVLKFNNPKKETFINNWYRALYEREWGSNQQERGEQLDPEQVSAHIEDEVEKSAADLKKQLFADIQLTAIASNPLLLTLIANTHRADTFLPKRRVELYERICNLFLGTRPYVKGTKLSLTATENQALLQLLAWELVQNETTQFTLTEATRWIAEKLARFNKEQPVSSKQFLEEMRDISGLLVEKEVELYEFSHQTFQEYLIACHVKELGEAGEKVLFENLANDRWREVICFYAAQLDATRLINQILDTYTYSEKNNLDLLDLADWCRVQGREISQETFQRLDELLLSIPSMANQNVVSISGDIPIRSSNTPIISIKEQARTFEKFKYFFLRGMISLNENIDISQALVFWKDFQLFLQDVSNGQFHATLELSEQKRLIPALSVEFRITWGAAQWFCGWLSTQAEIAPDEGTYHYRLPTEGEWQKISEDFPLEPFLARGARGNLQPLTQSADIPGNALCIVREQVHPRYANLINYLANARWQEADDETRNIMLEVTGNKDYCLYPKDLKTFPCQDLQLLDQLWSKFSGGHFGFSIQKDIYVSCGGVPDHQFYAEAEEKFKSAVNWKKQGHYWPLEFRIKGENADPPGCLPYQGLVVSVPRSFFENTLKNKNRVSIVEALDNLAINDSEIDVENDETIASMPLIFGVASRLVACEE
ncbi:signal transduction protein with nacht domain protein [Leptolyngbya sp. Heron Island J]|uniref:GUN4 domain-containing protein n=1 Tax=Leptolyngbya sp. Heron Island J TaxID=1385935 RepID=UPI0003B9D3C6|nr:GUN4 domain-containing protein [Leptolyngbya sp. Heron Island J]ESA32393.1 signal transduction protein with nacht domain protein [Leptolyngbya sp. Heron Island J]